MCRGNEQCGLKRCYNKGFRWARKARTFVPQSWPFWPQEGAERPLPSPPSRSQWLWWHTCAWWVILEFVICFGGGILVAPTLIICDQSWAEKTCAPWKGQWPWEWPSLVLTGVPHGYCLSIGIGKLNCILNTFNWKKIKVRVMVA